MWRGLIILNSDCAIAYNEIHCAVSEYVKYAKIEYAFHQTLFPRAIKRLGTRLQLSHINREDQIMMNTFSVAKCA